MGLLGKCVRDCSSCPPRRGSSLALLIVMQFTLLCSFSGFAVQPGSIPLLIRVSKVNPCDDLKFAK